MDTRACCGCSPGTASSGGGPADLLPARERRQAERLRKRRVVGWGPREKRQLAFSASAGMTSSSDPASRRRGRLGTGCSRPRSTATSMRSSSSRACYEPLVQRVVWKLKLPLGCEREDLAQEARVGLLAAIRAWRPERGPFPAFADRCVSNQALLALKATAAQKHQVLSRRHPARRAAVPARQPSARPPVTRADRDARGPPRHGHRSRAATARARTADERLTRPALAHGERARRARDGGERAEPHAARVHAPRLAARRVAGGPPRAPQARGRPRTGSLTITRLHTAARSEPGWMAFDEPGRPGPDGAPPRPGRRRVGRVAEARCGVEVDARHLDVGVPRGRVDRHPLPRPGIADALELRRVIDAAVEQALPEPAAPQHVRRSPTSSRSPGRRSPPRPAPRPGSGCDWFIVCAGSPCAPP